MDKDKRFLSSDRKLLESGMFSDVTVKCGDRAWSLHKTILCSRSVWFEKALTGSFAEAKSGIVNIEDFEPEAIDILIQYIYTGTYDIPSLSPTTKSNFVLYLKVYTVGDFFNLPSLSKMIRKSLTAEFNSKVAQLERAYNPDDSDFWGISPDWLPELFEAIRLLYNEVPLSNTFYTAPQGLRAAFLSFIHSACYYLLLNEHFNAFLDEVPAFALDVFHAMRQTDDFRSLAMLRCG